MSSILTSGCGITFAQQGRPSWTKVLKVCGVEVIDAGGPAVSNEYILNKTIETLNNLETPVDHVVCQLTGLGKLDIDVEGTDYKVLLGLNFEKYKPKLICVEIHNKDLRGDVIYKFLVNKGYTHIWSGVFSHLFKIS